MILETRRYSSKWVSDALLIAGVPAIIYVLTFTFELSYASEFGIPASLITITWNDAFVVAFLFLAIDVPVFVASSFVFSLSPLSKRRPEYVSALIFTPFMLMALSDVYAAWEDWHAKILISLLIGAIAMTVLSLPLMLRLKRILLPRHRDNKLHEPVDPKMAYRSQSALVVCMWLFVSFMTSVIVGSSLARHRTHFYVTQTSPETVMLGIWGDTVVAAPFDRKTRTIRQEFIITRISDRSALDIRLERVGPLHIDDSSIK